MNSPFARVRQKVERDSHQLADNWLARRVEAIQAHEPSVDALQQTLLKVGAVLLDQRISTDLRMEETLTLEDTRPSERVGYRSHSIIPAIAGGPRETIPHGLGRSWTPDVALQLNLVFRDTYNYQGKGIPPPTGEVRLFVETVTWGELDTHEAAEIKGLGDGKNTWARYGDQGHGRRGTSVGAVREPGQIISLADAETMLAPLALHVLDYFNLVQRPELAVHQVPGNFTTRQG